MAVSDPRHIDYLAKRGVNAELVATRYATSGDDLCILYCDPSGIPYLDSRGQKFIVRRPFPDTKPKFKAPHSSGSRPYFSPLMPEGYLDDITIPLVFIEGPIKVDACYLNIPTGYCFVGLTGTWNTKDRRDENGKWDPDGDTRILPELKAIPMRGRQVITLFDSDIDDNISVDDAASDIANWTRQRGAKPHRCTLPSEPDGRKNGADDFLVRHGATALLELLEAAEIEGWPLPAPLLTRDGDLKRSYTPAERKRLVAALAEVSDVQTVDDTCRMLATKLRIPYSTLLADIDDARSGTAGDGFLGGEEELEGDDDLDQNWVVPYILPRGETIVLSADPGVGKSLLCYTLAHACASGGQFLGFPVPRGVPLILQLEEGGSFKRRVKAVGLAKSAGCDGLPVNQRWFFSKTFDLAKPRQVEQLKLLIRSQVDLVIVDSARAVARSLSVDENHADFGKLVIRKIAKIISDCGKSGIIVHHNNGNGKASGTKDIPAGVWGVFNLQRDESATNLRTLRTDKIREGTSILWQLSLEQCEGADGSSDGWEWGLVADMSHMAPDLNWRKRFFNLLLMQGQPITFRDAGELMGLSDTELHSMRNSVLRDRSLMRWADGPVRKGSTTRFFVPHEMRPAANLHTSGENTRGVQTRDSHPIEVSEKSVEVGQESSQGLPSLPTHNFHTEAECVGDAESTPTLDQECESGVEAENPANTGESANLHTKGENLYGVSLSPLDPQAETPKSVEVGIPVYVDGSNGWTSPSGRIDRERVVLIDPQGNSRLIERKRISLKPPAARPALIDLDDLPF